MGKLTNKDKHTVKAGNHPHTNMISKPVNMRGGEYKCSILEMHFKLRDQQCKTILYTYRLLYQNLMVTANEKSIIYTQKRKMNPNKSQEKKTQKKKEKKTTNKNKTNIQ